MTVQLDPTAVPPGYFSILSQNRAFPLERIIDVQGQLSGGTVIYLEGGREAKVDADINTVLRAIDEATWGDGIEVEDLASPFGDGMPNVEVVPPWPAWLDAWRQSPFLAGTGTVAETPSVACPARPGRDTLAEMQAAGTTHTSTCIKTVNHGPADHLLVVLRGGVTFADKHPLFYTLLDRDAERRVRV